MSKLYLPNRRIIIALAVCVLVFVGLTLMQDLVRSNLNNTGYYFSESFIFSSFWWIFPPLLYVQYLVFKHTNPRTLPIQLALFALPLIVHLFAFPLLVWVLSKAFNDYTFTIQQTLRYTLSEHIYQLVLLYAIPLGIYHLTGRMKVSQKMLAEESNVANPFIESILVSEGNKKYSIAVTGIHYFSANAPYINIHVAEKKYLHSETLKSISTKLNPAQFVRIHKSAIINIDMTDSYTSRLNGDYDVTMKNGVKLRVSRNFAADFKNRLQESHRFTNK